MQHSCAASVRRGTLVVHATMRPTWGVCHHVLACTGLYDAALAAVRDGLPSGAAQDAALVATTKHLATAAARAQASSALSDAALLWVTLRTHLRWHVAHCPRPQLRAAAASAALAASPTLSLPCWLTSMFEV